MGKFVSEVHITGDKGVAEFHRYCSNHNPFIIWRQESGNDFGIDGEIEMTFKNDLNKIEASGEILKVQIKSTLKGSYIHKETDDSFEFYARKEDVEYWNRHKLKVILVIFDESKSVLYCKKITQSDLGYIKTKQNITFDKNENRLEFGKNDLVERYSSEFKSRINFSMKEDLYTNLFKFSSLPSYVYSYDAKVNSAKEIFGKMESLEVPIFVLKSKKIYVFSDLTPYSKFCSEIIDVASKVSEPFKKLFKDVNQRRIIIELLNSFFKNAVRSKGIGYNKQYKRYYFFPHKEDKERIILYSGKSGRKDVKRTVVSYKEYGLNKFHKHHAFEIKHHIIDDSLYVSINPQYLFTSDGKLPLADKALITKLTNYLTSREFNQAVLNHVHSLYSYLSNREGKIVLCEIEGCPIQLTMYHREKINFGIPIDNNSDSKRMKNKKTKMDSSTQPNLFGNEN